MDIVSHRLPVGGPSSFLQGLRDGELEPGFTSIPIAPTPLRNNLVGTAGVGIGRTNPFSLHVVARSPGGRQKDLFDLIGPSRLTEMAGVSKEEECFVLPPLPIHRVQDVSHEEGDGTEREPFGLFEKRYLFIALPSPICRTLSRIPFRRRQTTSLIYTNATGR